MPMTTQQARVIRDCRRSELIALASMPIDQHEALAGRATAGGAHE